MARKSKYEINWQFSAVKEHELKRFKIYAHIEKVEPFRMYVGKTKRKLEDRFSCRGGKDYGGRFGEYLEEHPLTEMTHVVLATTDDPVEAKQLEEYYTEQFCTTDPRFGFNTYIGSNPNEKFYDVSIESKCIYTYIIRHPNGNETITDNLKAFCREHSINQGGMCRYGHSKGYEIISKTLKQKKDNIVKNL